MKSSNELWLNALKLRTFDGFKIVRMLGTAKYKHSVFYGSKYFDKESQFREYALCIMGKLRQLWIDENSVKLQETLRELGIKSRAKVDEISVDCDFFKRSLDISDSKIPYIVRINVSGRVRCGIVFICPHTVKKIQGILDTKKTHTQTSFLADLERETARIDFIKSHKRSWKYEKRHKKTKPQTLSSRKKMEKSCGTPFDSAKYGFNNSQSIALWEKEKSDIIANNKER